MFLVMKRVLIVLCHEPMMIKCHPSVISIHQYPIRGYSVYMEVIKFCVVKLVSNVHM
jgi:hypothetical protein